MLSEKSTWKREGNDVVFNSNSGRYLYEGKIDTNNETIAGRYKHGTTKKYLLQSYPEGDFSMVKQ